MLRAAIFFLVVSLLAGCAHRAAPASAQPDLRPALLAARDGSWIASGDVLGEAVTYTLIGSPVLGNSFTELHMVDQAETEPYEARVFIGYDEKSDQIYTHWLDNFGARFSIPHGTGTLSEDTILFIVPYEAGTIRDILVFDAEAMTWSFTIEAATPEGDWKHFAKYELKR